MVIDVRNIADFEQMLEQKDALLAYFSTPECSVCHVLKPKVQEMVERKFVRMKMVFVDAHLSPELAAKYGVFTAPTILVFFAGKEFIRKSRLVDLSLLEQDIDRIYRRMFV